MSEEKNETKKKFEYKFEFYIGSAFLAAIYSLIKMSIESNGDFERFIDPLEYFFINFSVGALAGLIIATPINLISKGEFSKTLFWTILIIIIMTLTGLGS